MTISAMSLRARILTLLVGFVIMALAIMVFGLASLSDYSRMMGDYGRAYENAYMGERLNHMITASLMESRGLYLSKSAEDDQRFIRNIEKALQDLEDVVTQWQAEKIASPDMHLDNLAARVEAFRQQRYEVLRVTRTQSKQAGEKLGISYRPQRLALQADIERVVSQTRQTLVTTKARADAYGRDRMGTFVLATLAWITITTLLTLWVIAHFITREITRIRIEDEKREKLLKQLLETNTELERFAYVASHDMQEPVRMINIYCGIIASDYSDKLDDTGREYLGIITSSTRRMLSLVQDLVQYSGFQHDHERHVTVDLNIQLDHIHLYLGKLITDTSARIEAEALPKVTGNPIQIQRLMSNLIANAIKYQPRYQRPVIKITATDLGEKYCITISDNGIGIPPQFVTEIFAPFRRLHTWDEYEGSGMGLAICRKITEHHGGRIWVEAPADAGTRINFTLPKAT